MLLSFSNFAYETRYLSEALDEKGEDNVIYAIFLNAFVHIKYETHKIEKMPLSPCLSHCNTYIFLSYILKHFVPHKVPLLSR